MKYIASLLLFVCSLAYAGPSTINATIPAANSALQSAPIRANFLAAQNDINNLIEQNYGVSAPVNPIEGQMWINTTSTPFTWNVFDGVQWDTVGTINASTGLAQAYSINWTGVTNRPTTLSGYGITNAVSSVSLTMPSIFTVTGSPITGAGTFVASLNNQPQGNVFAAPSSSTGAPTFRALVKSDLPAGTLLSTTAPANNPATGTPSSTTYLRGDGTWATPAGSGTVTSVSVVSANGLGGSVATATSTPTITLSTSVSGIVKGNGTGFIVAAPGTDYAPATSGSSILYGNGAGGFSNVLIGTGLTFSGGSLAVSGSGTVTGPGSSTNGYLPQWNGATGNILAAGLPVGTTGNNTVVETNGSGIIAASILPAPTASTLGGVESIVGLSNNWLSYIDTSGVPHLAQPGFGNLSGSATCSQLPSLTGDATTSAGSCATTVSSINGTSLAGLSTGILKNTTSTGAPSIAVVGTDYVAPSGSVANMAGGTAGQIPYQSAPNVSGFFGPCQAGQSIVGAGTASPTCALGVPYVDVTGTSDAIVATYSPAITTLYDGETLAIGPAYANATTSPTLQVNSLTAYTIYKNNKSLLVAGDIPGSNAQVLVQYSAGGGSPYFILINPAVASSIPLSGITGAGIGVITGLSNAATGSGSPVLATLPTLVAPNIGAATATSINGNAITAGSGTLTLGAGQTLTVTNGMTLAGPTGTGNVVFANSPTLVTPALGTPSALVGTNITGTASGFTVGTANAAPLTGITGFGTGVATVLGTAVTGSGAPVAATSPTVTTQTIDGYTESSCAPTITAGAITITATLIPTGCSAISTLQKLSLVANTTVTLPTPAAGISYSLLVCASGAYSPTWAIASGTLSWPAGSIPTATATSGKCDLYSFVALNSSYLFGSAVLNFTGS